MTKTVEQRRRAFQMLDVIEANPDKHDQSMWCYPYVGLVNAEFAMGGCGATLCSAGWTVLLEGLTIADGHNVVETGATVPYEAARLLGLGAREEIALFAATEDLAGVRKVVNEIFGPRPCENCPNGYDCETGQYATAQDVE